MVHERLKYLTEAINRSGVIEIEFNLELKGLLICAAFFYSEKLGKVANL